LLSPTVAGSTSTENAFVAIYPAAATWTVNELVPTAPAVGVPESTPEDDKDMPSGRFPDKRDHV